MAARKLKVMTSFPDVATLVEGFVERVDEGTLMLYAAVSYDEGDSVAFEVLLDDNTIALAGTGRSVGSFDGGADRPADARFDVVIDTLSFEGAAGVVYDRILQMRGGMTTGEMDVSDMPATGGGFDEEYEAQPTRIAPPDVDVDVEMSFESDPHTVVRDMSEAVEEAAAANAVGASDESTMDVPWDAPAKYSSAPPTSASVESPWETEEPASPSAHPSARPNAQPSHRPRAASVPPTDWDDAGLDGALAAGEHTDEISAPEDESESYAAPAPSARPSSLPPGPAAAWESEIADRMSLAGGASLVLAPVPGEPAPPPPFAVQHLPASGPVLLRAARARAWDGSNLPDHREPRPSEGHFAYGAGQLPVPTAPPMPDGGHGAAPGAVAADDGGFIEQSSGRHAGFGEEDETDLLEEEA